MHLNTKESKLCSDSRSIIKDQLSEVVITPEAWAKLAADSGMAWQSAQNSDVRTAMDRDQSAVQSGTGD